jgi:formylglycine-generating enzyme required for sulfatase activity
LSSVDIQSVNVDATGTITERPSGQVSAFRETLDNNVGLDMVQIPAGEFVMGSPAEETGRDDDEGPQRTVTVPRFFIGRFQVTQAQYEAVMGQNPSRFKGADRPVEQVSWDDAVAFCEKLSGLVGRTYRLPSEAEWEYACRAKTTAPFNVGPTLTTDLANYNGNESYGNGPKGIFREETTDVGSFPPNAFGLHDMHGNVYEWCQDVWHENYEGAPTDGSAWVDGGDQAQRVLRGGSWFIHPVICRSADRLRGPRDGFNVDVGFRVVLVPA